MIIYLISIVLIFDIIYGLYEIYERKIMKKKYKDHDIFNMIFMGGVFFQYEIKSEYMQWILGILSIVVFFILLDKLYYKLKNKGANK
ncbi:MAG: hypothetical protein GX275_04960 [Clostridiales bacterium]|nr:hypothetical protein [Clostridiales bacterium]